MEFKRTRTTEITVFELESNSATEPRYFKIVWSTNDYNVTNSVECWENKIVDIGIQFSGESDNHSSVYANAVPIKDWCKLSEPVSVAGLPTMKKSIETLAGILGIKNF